jgi:hypothetical protein
VLTDEACAFVYGGHLGILRDFVKNPDELAGKALAWNLEHRAHLIHDTAGNKALIREHHGPLGSQACQDVWEHRDRARSLVDGRLKKVLR